MEECRIELLLSVRSTRRLLHKFRRDDRREELDLLLDMAYSCADREDLITGDCVELMAALAALRQVICRAMNGEAVLQRDIDLSGAIVRRILDRPRRDREGQVLRRPPGDHRQACPGQA